MSSPSVINLTTFGGLPQEYRGGNVDTVLYGLWGWLTFTPGSALYIPNHVELAKARLVEQFKEYRKIGVFPVRPEKINKLVEGFVLSFQGIEDEINDLAVLRWLDSATAAQLDEIGKIVGIGRLYAQSDDDFRVSIKFQIFINSSNGEPERLIALCKFVTNTPAVLYKEYWPARVYLQLEADQFPEQFAEKILKVMPAGIGLSVISIYENPVFTFDWDGLPIGRGLGLNEKGYAPGGIEVGGRIAERIV